MKPLVSVCIITYQHQAYIKKCLDGVLMQKTSFDFEIIIGEDGSADDTSKICEEYVAKYPEQITLFKRDRKDVIYINNHPTGRFNFIENLKSAKGKYIALCEGDDYWIDSNKLQKQVDFLESHEDFNICFHDVNLLIENTQKVTKDTIAREVPEITDRLELLKGNYIHMASVVLRNDFRLPEWFKMAQLGDWAFYLITLEDKKIKRIKEEMSIYRRHDQGIWTGKSELFRVKSLCQANQTVLKNLYLNKEETIVVRDQIRRYKRILNTNKQDLFSRIKRLVKKLYK